MPGAPPLGSKPILAPFGKMIAVVPVRASILVLCPTMTPGTSVIELFGPVAAPAGIAGTETQERDQRLLLPRVRCNGAFP